MPGTEDGQLPRSATGPQEDHLAAGCSMEPGRPTASAPPVPGYRASRLTGDLAHRREQCCRDNLRTVARRSPRPPIPEFDVAGSGKAVALNA